MKHILKVIVMIIMIVPALLAAQEIKLSAEMWNRWTLENAKAPGDSSDVTSKNYFSLERGYVGLEAKFSETVKGRFTADLFSTDALADGAGLKLKYAYLDFANLLPIPDLTLTTGLQKVYFGTIYDWNYTYIGKAPSDEYKLANSADYGVSLNGFIPGGWGEYALGMYNGEGYKAFGTALKDNTEPAFLANLRLTPIPGLTVGGSVMTNSVERKTKLSDATLNAAYNEQLLLDGLVRLAYGPVDITAEYMSKNVQYANAPAKDYTATSLSMMPVLNLKAYTGSDIQILGRWDRWDETDNPSKVNLLTAVTAGINYNFMHDESANPAMQLQLNYTTKSYDEAESAAAYSNGLKDSSQLMLQLKWRFANTIK
ncbi:MAG TPA: hypothetical protein P5533_07215 [Candidatus Cloacimonadota bacterium]|nr:hypothetical protein [Candidatus Cloacimonadota bacterium]